ncbi:treacle protein isoform X1 [Zootoca vivipara]|uniref:treacle protein isoform X1 n=1 Tax=Zootoca vivipara TaxID=8524 RepID=UPI00293B9FBA|nr:treacle protein isoform X1 [Zootoca vivipara]
MAAAGGSEQKELLALIHQHLVQFGYERAARELLAQSGQKTFLPSPVPLKDIFTQWKKTSSQGQKRKAEEIKQGSPAKIRIPDPNSSSESSEEEAAKPIKSNAAVNNSSLAKAESSSEDEESSSEEEEAACKEVKVSAAGNKTSNLLQLAAQKTNSFPGKGVAVAAVQAKGQQKKATANKPSTPAVTKAGQNKILPVKPGSASQPLAGQNASQAAAARKTTNSESSSSSSSSESEEEKTPAAVKTPVPKPALKKAESSSGDSSDDSDSEEETNTATLQVKAAVESRQVNTTLTKSVPATTVKASPAKKTAQPTRAGSGNVAKTTKPADSSETSDSSDTDIEEPSLATQVKPAVESRQVNTTLTKSVPATPVKASPAKKTAQQTRAGSGNVAKTTKPADSSETSDSSDTDIGEPSLATQAKSPGKTPQTFSSPVKSAAAPSLLSTKTVTIPALLKQTPKTSAVKQPPPAKAAGGVKKAESSESSESSSESEDEAPSVPVTQKKLQTPQPPAGARQNQIDKPGTPAKAASRALKGKETESESSSSSSDSQDEMIPPSQHNLPPPFATKANAAPQVVSAAKSLPPPGGPLQKTQESEDSSQDSSDESDAEEDKVFTQKPAQETQKPTPAPAAKMAGATSGKAGNAQPAGKVWTASPLKSAAASLQKAAESSETDSSHSSEHEVAAAKPVKQPPIHPFFLPKGVKTAAPPGKHAQASSSTPNSVSTMGQGPAAVTTGKVEQSSSKKPKLSQAPLDKPDGILKHESSGSSSSSDGEEEALTTTKQISQPARIPQKQGVGGKPESSSEATSSDEEASQSLLKTPLPTLPKGAAPALSKQSSGKPSSALRSPPISMASGDSSSSDSSDSDADAKEIVGQKTEIGPLPSSGKEVARTKGAKGATARKKGAGSISSKAASAKKVATKAQRNGSTKRNPAGQLPLTLLASTQTARVGSEEAAAQVPGAAAQGEPQATPVVAVKPPKSSKAGAKEKPPKKRKLAAGDAGPGKPKKKKLKAESGVEVPKKLKKKKKAKSTDNEKPKKKSSKDQKDKKKKSKKLESLTPDGSQKKKKKKKKKKTGDLEGAA